MFLRLPFGIKTAGASFTRAIEKAIENIPEARTFVIAFVADVKTLEEGCLYRVVSTVNRNNWLSEEL